MPSSATTSLATGCLRGPRLCHTPSVSSSSMSLPLPSSLSPSKVASFKDCALAFKFSTIDRLPEPSSPAATKGTLVHRALQLLMHAAPDERGEQVALTALHQAHAELRDDPE